MLPRKSGMEVLARALAAAAGAAGDRAHRAGRARGPRRRTGRRRRRLPRQAVRPRRARGADPRPAALGAPGAGDDRPPRPASRSTCSPAACAANGEPVRLTNTEFDLLAYFMNHPGQVSTASRSSAPCGATAMIRPRTSSTSTSATCAASSPPAIGRCRSGPCAPAGTGSRTRAHPSRDRPAPASAGDLVAWVTGVLLAALAVTSSSSTNGPVESCAPRSTTTSPGTWPSSPRRSGRSRPSSPRSVLAEIEHLRARPARTPAPHRCCSRYPGPRDGQQPSGAARLLPTGRRRDLRRAGQENVARAGAPDAGPRADDPQVADVGKVRFDERTVRVGSAARCASAPASR